ncbi:MAG: 3-dehydrosphinganine reductase [Piccolia ochrophora]|nr:MAG: 3-dehydrosphinganine reductase [Piccolia ochrophora]
MGIFQSRNKFEVDGKTILITGGSQGMGHAVAKLLAQKGANVVIVARNVSKLQEAIQDITSAALHPSTQRFHYISADLTSPMDASRIISETTTWNNDRPPDTVWCIAGSAHPDLFLSMTPDRLRDQMNINYFSAAYVAHATLSAWLKPSPSSISSSSALESASPAPPRHLILTSSVLAFYPIVGYTAYAPAKTALRSLSDTLRQELLLYSGASQHPSTTSPLPEVRIHTVFPGGILSPGYEAENVSKPGVTKLIEEEDKPQTADEVAARSVAGLERGEYLIVTSLLSVLLRALAWGGSPRSSWVWDTLVAWVLSVVWAYVGWDLDRKVWKWGREKGRPVGHGGGKGE